MQDSSNSGPQVQGAAPGPRPQSVTNAVRLLYISVILGVVGLVIELVLLPPEATIAVVGLVLVVAAIFIGITVWLIVKIGKGRNWARITFLVLFLIGIALDLIGLPATLVRNLLAGIIDIIQILLQAGAVALLFGKASGDWFKALKAKA